MSPDKHPSPWLTVPIFFGLFFGGGYLGILMSHFLVPESDFAEFVSFLTLPAAFIIGLVAWAGTAIPGAVRRFVLLVLQRHRSPTVIGNGQQATIPPGSSAFVPAALVTCLAAGTVVGAISTRLGFGWVLCLYAGLGLGYGVACWQLARAGYLPFPRE